MWVCWCIQSGASSRASQSHISGRFLHYTCVYVTWVPTFWLLEQNTWLPFLLLHSEKCNILRYLLQLNVFWRHFYQTCQLVCIFHTQYAFWPLSVLVRIAAILVSHFDAFRSPTFQFICKFRSMKSILPLSHNKSACNWCEKLFANQSTAF